MFNNKKDPLVDSVKAVMEANSKRRDAESRVNEAFGVTSKRGLPHELHADYDAALQKATEIALKEGVEVLDENKKNWPYKPKFPVKGDDDLESEGAKVTGKYKSRHWKKKKDDDEKLKKEEVEQVDEGKFTDAVKSLGKKIAVNTYKNRKYVAAQNEPGDNPEQHARRIAHVKSLAKEEVEPTSQIKESFEHFLRNKFLKD